MIRLLAVYVRLRLSSFFVQSWPTVTIYSMPIPLRDFQLDFRIRILYRLAGTTRWNVFLNRVFWRIHRICMFKIYIAEDSQSDFGG